MAWAIGKSTLSLSMFKDKQDADNIKTGYEENLGAKEAAKQTSAFSNDDGGGGKGESFTQGEIDAAVADEQNFEMF